MKYSADEIKKIISEAIPEGRVVTDHNEHGHFYKIVDDAHPDGITYPSVTGKIQIIKDEGLINYKMNRALDYVFENFKFFDDSNVMEHLDKASRVSVDILEDAGDIGTEIHDAREEYFRQWIESGQRPADILSFLKPGNEDVRAVSALRALDRFIADYNYRPIATELLVYNHKIKVGGMLDDLGIITSEVRPGDRKCQHEIVSARGIHHCVKCDYKAKDQFALMDIKSSNQFKDHYFFQVALYYWMFYELTKEVRAKGLRPERCFILKLSKTDGMYKIEDLYRPSTLASYARSMVRTHSGIAYIRSLRKDNQKTVLKL